MEWQDVKGFISGVAPTVGTLLGGPVGGAVVKMIADKLGVEEKPDAVIDALKANPDALLKIKELENSKTLAELQASIDVTRMIADSEKANLATVTGAQTMQVSALAQDDLFSKRFIYGFAILWSLFAMVYIASITFGTIPQASVRFADTILGFLLGTAMSGILQFFYGSSVGSRKAQDSLIERSRG